MGLTQQACVRPCVADAGGMGTDGGRTVTGSNRAEAARAPWHVGGDPADEARRVIRARFTAWNRADRETMRAVMHVPHASLPGLRLAICENESALVRCVDVRGPAVADDWHHNLLERLDIQRWSADKVHCALEFGKNAADGRRYADAEAVFVITRRGRRWAIAFNSVTLLPIGVGGGDHATAVDVTTDLFRRWLAARDAGDVAAMLQQVHLPFVELRGTRLVVHRRAAALRRDAARTSGAPAPQRRELRRVEVRERSSNKVTLEADVAQVGPGRSMMRCESSLVIATELQGRWALQFLSTF
jgi:hypothetical protein